MAQQWVLQKNDGVCESCCLYKAYLHNTDIIEQEAVVKCMKANVFVLEYMKAEMGNFLTYWLKYKR